MYYHRERPNTLDKERLALLALHFIPGIGSFLIKQLIGYCGSASNVFNADKGKLLKIPNIGTKISHIIRIADPFEYAEAEWEKIAKKNVRILFFNDTDFPQRLRQLDDGPSMLYVKGNADLNAEKTVGIVGTRQATSYGKKIVEKLVEELVNHQPLIISGLAYGVDIHAHKQSLKRGVATLGVLGSGIDVIYPAAHSATAEKMIVNGGLITENPIGSSPEAYRFPIRNRIIAGLSDALIVVETADKGGALITAEIANNYSKDVFAVPGDAGSRYSSGCNKLIKANKAHLLTGIQDLEYIMGWDSKNTQKKKEDEQHSLAHYSLDEQKVITLLKKKQGAMAIDELSRQTSLSPSNLASILLNLEFKNVISAIPGKRYTLGN